MKHKERIQHLLEFIRYDYPRAASILKYSIGHPRADETFNELLICTDVEKAGFDNQVFEAINELHDIHLDIMRD